MHSARGAHIALAFAGDTFAFPLPACITRAFSASSSHFGVLPGLGRLDFGRQAIDRSWEGGIGGGHGDGHAGWQKNGMICHGSSHDEKIQEFWEAIWK